MILSRLSMDNFPGRHFSPPCTRRSSRKSCYLYHCRCSATKCCEPGAGQSLATSSHSAIVACHVRPAPHSTKQLRSINGLTCPLCHKTFEDPRHVSLHGSHARSHSAMCLQLARCLLKFTQDPVMTVDGLQLRSSRVDSGSRRGTAAP